ncbi:hypothetical protein [Paenibacillus oryzisoli]|uniref:Uncharacterized protein n=1 Tax=Paenibacillus oryzisoli TaxID=1850517 RepID=A0A198AB88_9BACL|nr:hypothetical protein [Paenibacillus oryzisoli]OAS18375.1 hypothetical protein A8708_00105 [Paenibacillus oryzisoli]
MAISIHLKNDYTPGRLAIPTVGGTNDHHKSTDKHKRNEHGDNISISPLAHNLFSKNGWKQPILERLMEHKQNIMDRRSEYISNGLEKGISPDEMKTELKQIDNQIQDITKQIQQLQQEDFRKATGLGEKELKENEGAGDKTIKGTHSSNTQPSSVQLTPNIMKALISTNNEIKQVKSIKMAQLTLESESLNWASNPERSEQLKNRAAQLEGKMINTSHDAVSNLKQAAEQENEDTQQLPLIDDSHMAKPAAVNPIESNII